MSGTNTKKERLTCRVTSELVEELEKFGNKGTVGCDILNKFYKLKRFEKTIPPTGVIYSLDQAHVYPTFIDKDLFHITTKKGDQSMVIELDREAAAHFALEIIGLINQEQ